MPKQRHWLHAWWDDSVCGPWTENKLLSRKFLTVVFVIVVAVSLDIGDKALEESTASLIRDVTIAFVGVQGAIDWFKYRSAKKAEERAQRKKEREDVST